MTASDQAPKHIWIAGRLKEYGSYYPEAVEAEGEHGGTATQYVRADVADAMVAAAYEASANDVGEWGVLMDAGTTVRTHDIMHDIVELTPSDASAALAEAERKAWEAGRDAAAGAILSQHDDPEPGYKHWAGERPYICEEDAYRRIAALTMPDAPRPEQDEMDEWDGEGSCPLCQGDGCDPEGGCIHQD